MSDHTTLLNYLTAQNPVLDSSKSKKGATSANVLWINVDDVVEWEEFTYENIISLYGDLLEHRVDSSSLPGISPPIHPTPECVIWDEDTFEHLLTRGIQPIVSTALLKAFELSGSGGQMKDCGIRVPATYMWRSGSTTDQTDARFRPDWAGIQADNPSINICPGETKLSTKWGSAQRNDKTNKAAFLRVISQIVTYCKACKVRYGYIITQDELVVIRVTKSPEIAQPLSTSREPRSTANYGISSMHQRGVSTTSTISQMSSVLSEMSLNPPTSAYSDGSNPATDLKHPEIKSIPWSNYGPGGGLTIKLALFAIHMMACSGQAWIDSQYPPLDSWHQRNGAERPYVHNTTGRTSEKCPKNFKELTPASANSPRPGSQEGSGGRS